jgi:hypothetical protein
VKAWYWGVPLPAKVYAATHSGFIGPAIPEKRLLEELKLPIPTVGGLNAGTQATPALSGPLVLALTHV